MQNVAFLMALNIGCLCQCDQEHAGMGILSFLNVKATTLGLVHLVGTKQHSGVVVRTST